MCWSWKLTESDKNQATCNFVQITQSVEVACSSTSSGHALLPKAVRFPPLRFAPLLFLWMGTTLQRWFPLFPVLNVHSIIIVWNTWTCSTNFHLCPVYLLVVKSHKLRTYYSVSKSLSQTNLVSRNQRTLAFLEDPIDKLPFFFRIDTILEAI